VAVAIHARVRSLSIIALVPWFLACASDDGAPGDDSDAGDLSVGELGESDGKADGNWGAALTCKTPPSLPRLPRPQIIVSIDGLTLRLVDKTVGFDKVFPVGVGARDTDPTSLTYGESLSYYPLAAYGKQDFVIKPSTIQPCKTWWTDPASGEKLPVFAGLPFLSWSGAYAIHGPIDNYRATSGGNLRRGYVSHGCIRMEAADVLEVYARIKGVASVPVHVQREVERTADGPRTDVASKWIGSECRVDADCNFTGGFCRANKLSGRGACTVRCTTTCADRAGQPATFCVADPEAAGKGMCVPKHTAVNADCRPYDHFVPAVRARPTQPGVTASVCVPGSPGWVGDRCLADADCKNGTRCGPRGVCAMPCDRFCADQPGYADTFCVRDDSLGAGGQCARQCTPASNASECSAGNTCVPRGRNGAPSTIKDVCIPR
jgi:hypothetical protein